jgi:ribulose 1,5-bisphosphate carboxylase large subunit-like protein
MTLGADARVIVEGYYQADAAPGDGFDKAFAAFIQQIQRDVVAGTFDDYDRSIFGSEEAHAAFVERSEAAARCYDARRDDDTPQRRFGFRLELAAELFADPAYGLQRLIHTLASDLFERRIEGINGRVQVTKIDLSALQQTYEATYRQPNQSYTITAIKREFALQADEPLLAFSLKPRACLLDDEYLRIAREAFEGGCHLVELDTRDLVFTSDRLALLKKLSQVAIDQSRERVCRFSANLSGPTYIVRPVLESLSALHAEANPEGPWVVKIDGDLDGLSTVQAVRSGRFSLYKQPILTCYPVLKYALQSALGRDSFVRMLALSGVDIIYPGQSPSFRKDRRIDTQQVTAAQEHYRDMDQGGYPMLSVAGGVFINSVHAMLSVLGPDIAFFVGGGIALSKHGIRKAAEHFTKAIMLSRRDLFKQEKIGNLEGQFVELVRIYFDDGAIPAEFDLVLPNELRAIPGLRRSKNLK